MSFIIEINEKHFLNILTVGIIKEGMKNSSFSIESSPTKVKPSIGTLMEQIKLIVVEKKCLNFDKNHYIKHFL